MFNCLRDIFQCLGGVFNCLRFILQYWRGVFKRLRDIFQCLDAMLNTGALPSNACASFSNTDAADSNACAAFSNTGAVSLYQFIGFPIFRIVYNIICNSFKRFIVAYDMFPIITLKQFTVEPFPTILFYAFNIFNRNN